MSKKIKISIILIIAVMIALLFIPNISFGVNVTTTSSVIEEKHVTGRQYNFTIITGYNDLWNKNDIFCVEYGTALNSSTGVEYYMDSFYSSDIISHITTYKKYSFSSTGNHHHGDATQNALWLFLNGAKGNNEDGGLTLLSRAYDYANYVGNRPETTKLIADSVEVKSLDSKTVVGPFKLDYYEYKYRSDITFGGIESFKIYNDNETDVTSLFTWRYVGETGENSFASEVPAAGKDFEVLTSNSSIEKLKITVKFKDTQCTSSSYKYKPKSTYTNVKQPVMLITSSKREEKIITSETELIIIGEPRLKAVKTVTGVKRGTNGNNVQNVYEGMTVYEGDIIEYTWTVTNTSEIDYIGQDDIGISINNGTKNSQAWIVDNPKSNLKFIENYEDNDSWKPIAGGNYYINLKEIYTETNPLQGGDTKEYKIYFEVVNDGESIYVTNNIITLKLPHISLGAVKNLTKIEKKNGEIINWAYITSNTKVESGDKLTYTWSICNTSEEMEYTGQKGTEIDICSSKTGGGVLETRTDGKIIDKPNENLKFVSGENWEKNTDDPENTIYIADLESYYKESGHSIGKRFSGNDIVEWDIIFEVVDDPVGTTIIEDGIEKFKAKVGNNELENEIEQVQLTATKELTKVIRNGTSIGVPDKIQNNDILIFTWTVKNISEIEYRGTNVDIQITNKLGNVIDIHPNATIIDSPSNNLTYDPNQSYNKWAEVELSDEDKSELLELSNDELSILLGLSVEQITELSDDEKIALFNNFSYQLNLKEIYNEEKQLEKKTSEKFYIAFQVNIDEFVDGETVKVTNNNIDIEVDSPKVEVEKTLTKIVRATGTVITNITSDTKVQPGDTLIFTWTVKSVGEAPYQGEDIENCIIVDEPNENLKYIEAGNWEPKDGNYELDLKEIYSETNQLAVGDEDDYDIQFEVKVTNFEKKYVQNNTIQIEIEYPQIHYEKFASSRKTTQNKTVEYNRGPTVTYVREVNGVNIYNYEYTETIKTTVVDAKIGDTVTYTIRVYNEGKGNYVGNVDKQAGYSEHGTIGKIIDKYSEGLKFKTGSTTNNKYGWTNTENEQKAVTEYLYNNNIKIEGTTDSDTGREKTKYVDIQIEFEIASIAELLGLQTNGVKGDVSEQEKKVTWGYGEELVPNYVDIKGTVWVDGREGKENEIDNKLDENDEKKAGVLVALKYKSGDKAGQLVENPINSTITDATKGNEYKINNPTITDANGNYSFNNIFVSLTEKKYDQNGNITDVYVKENDTNNEFYVEFFYDGMTYKDVEINQGTSTTSSKADEEKRQEFNNKFAEIVKGAAKRYGTAVNFDYNTLSMKNYTNDTTALEYTYPNSGKDGAKLQIKTEGTKNEFYTSGSNIVMNIKDKYVLSATTKQAGHIIKVYNFVGGSKVSVKKQGLENVNLGLIGRNEFDLSLRKDLDEAKVTIKNSYGEEFTETYNYNSRLKDDLKVEIRQSDIRSAYTNVYDLGVRKQDIDLTAGTIGIIGVEATYKISIFDQTTSYDNKITEIVDYYDTRLTPIGVSVEGGVASYTVSDGTIRITLGENQESMNGLKASSSGLNIYVTYSIDPNVIVNNDDLNINNYAEITKYKTYYTDGSIAGVIDRDSAPDTFDKSKDIGLDLKSEYENLYEKVAKREDVNVATKAMQDKTMPIFEDDADKAPGLTIKHTNAQRTLSGNVWEDKTASDTIRMNQERIGDGELKSEDTQRVEKVIVELWIRNNSGTYQICETKNTDTNGEYSFREYEPGNYMIKFRYGEESESADGNVIKYNGQDYKSTKYYFDYDTNGRPINRPNSDESGYWYDINKNTRLSDAIDDWQRRNDINNYWTPLTNHKSQLLAKRLKTESEFVNNTKMESYTNIMTMPIEYATTVIDATQTIPEYNVINIDFGIVERPRAELTVTKKVENVKIVLQNGTIQIDTNRSAPNVAWISKDINDSEGMIQATLDENLISGANIEILYSIKIENTGELDYNTKEYYYENTINGATPVGIIPSQVVDYPSNTLKFVKTKNMENGKWETKLQTNLVFDEHGTTVNLVENDLSTISTILVRENTTDIKPGNETKYEVTLDTITSDGNSGDNLVYENMVELIKSENPVGRKMETSILGNLNPLSPTEGLKEPDASMAESVAILPPYGDAKIFYVLGITTLLLLAGGIFLIKKKIIK